MIEVKKFTGNLADLVNWELDLDFWQDTQEIIGGVVGFPEEIDYMEVWFAYDRDRIVGFVFGENYSCIRIAVDYRYRNQGIGKQLVKESGFSKPYDVDKTEEARSFWISTGYKVPETKTLVTV
jgi:GNAT superfamily N-acetyltransferase